MTKQKLTVVEVTVENTVPVVFYKRGDELVVNGKQVKVVEVIETGRLHVKNTGSPYDSFIVLESELSAQEGTE